MKAVSLPTPLIADAIKNWLRNRATVEFLGLWEKINNTAFKGVEFDSFSHLRSLVGFNTAGKLK